MNKILIVEDEAIVATDLSQTLKDLGYKIVGTAMSGSEAHNAIKVNRPDLILMDVCIKGEVNGIELALDVFEKYNIPVVHLTAFSDDETITNIRKSQSFGYLTKPYAEKELYLAIELALEKHKILNNSKSLYMIYIAALEKIDEGVIVSDLEGHILHINPPLRTLLGVNQFDIHDYFVSNILKKDSAQKYNLIINGVVRQDIGLQEVELLDSHGKKKGHIYKLLRTI